MSHSHHSRFSKLKRRLRNERKEQRKERHLSKVQRDNKADQTPYSCQKILRPRGQQPYPPNLPDLPHRASQTDTRAGAKEYSLLLGGGIHVPSGEPD